jgi:hypothetical protein
MRLLLIIVFLLLILGAPYGGYRGWYAANYGWGGVGLLSLILILLLILGPW